MALLSHLTSRLNAAWHERAIVLKAMSFAAVGVINSAVDFALFSLGFYHLGLPIIAADSMEEAAQKVVAAAGK